MNIVIEFGPKISAHRLTEEEFQNEYRSQFNQHFVPEDAVSWHQYATEKVWLMPNGISVVKGIGGYDIYVLCREVATPKHSLKNKG